LVRAKTDKRQPINSSIPVILKTVFKKKSETAVLGLTSYFSMLLKKHMLTDPIIFEIIIPQNQNI